MKNSSLKQFLKIEFINSYFQVGYATKIDSSKDSFLKDLMEFDSPENLKVP